MAKIHAYLNVRGDYDAAAYPRLTGEVWQYGIRLALTIGAPGSQGDITDGWSVEEVSESRTVSLGTVTTNYLINGPGGVTFSPDDYLEDQVAQAVKDYTEALPLAGPVRVRELVVYAVASPDGDALPAGPDAYAARFEYSVTVGSAGTGQMLPPDVSCAVSLQTNRLGKRGRGRYYLPALSSITLASDGLFDATRVTTIADESATFLSALQRGTPSAPQVHPAVIGGSFDSYATVTGVRVGHNPDTQRRRTNKIPELYTATALA